MNVLITGISGFLAGYLHRNFVNQGHQVFGISRSPLEEEIHGVKVHVLQLPDPKIYQLIKIIQPQLVIHAAGTASVPESVIHPYDDFSISVPGTAMLLDALRQHQPHAHFIFLSSAAVYGNPDELPIIETKTQQPISPYGYHKWMGELLCQEYANLYGLKCSVLRIFSAYGIGLQRQVIYEMTKKLIKSNKNRTMSIFFGTGNESRDFIHASDVVEAIQCIMHRETEQFEVFNGASGVETKIGDLAKLIQKQVGEKANFIFNGEIRKGDPLNWSADITSLQQLGFQPKITIESGVEELVKWVKNEPSH